MGAAFPTPRLAAPLREALGAAGYTEDAVARVLGTSPRLGARATRAVHLRRLGDDGLSTLVRLLLLGEPVPRAAAARALGPAAAGLLEGGDPVTSPLHVAPLGGLWVAGDGRRGPRGPDLVLGVTPAGRTLAELTIRRPVEAALDLGTGCGIQALLAAAHARRVVAVDVNPRGLDYVRFNATLNALANVDPRRGSWLEPVAGERFGLLVANPPFVVSPDSALVYRDSGEAGDALFLRLLGSVGGALAEGGFAQVLGNWLPAGGDWRAPLEAAVAGTGCDALLLRFLSQDAAWYAAAWNQELAEEDPAAFEAALDRWLAHYAEAGIESVAAGLVVLRRRSGSSNWTRALDVPASATAGAGEHVLRLVEGWDWARSASDAAVLEAAYALPAGGRIVERWDAAGGAPAAGRMTVEVRPNAGLAARVDPATAGILRLCDARRPLRELLAGLPESGRPGTVAAVRRLVGLGLLTVAGRGRKIEEP